IFRGVEELKLLTHETGLHLLNDPAKPTFRFHRRHLMLDLGLCSYGLKSLADLHIIPAQLAEEAAQAYLELRKHQHAMKLQGLGKLELPTQQVQSQVQAVQALWQAVME
ncbi:hypothetical protein, partial [Neptunomonas phycophila]|uniref:hypothetical protein n=1 Tax=Neptunomonas phycophila TaxID=1572645 RepID=UPI0023F876DC